MTSSLLDCLLDPLARTLSRQQADQILSWRLDANSQARLAELREKANDGLLSAVEDEEYKRFVEDLDTIAIIQAKARQAPSADAA